MTDKTLVERLREYVAEIADAYWPSPYMKEAVGKAADRIEELEAERETYKGRAEVWEDAARAAQKRNAKLERVVEAHCQDLERCADVLSNYGKPSTFASTRAELRLAAKELREALAALEDPKPASNRKISHGVCLSCGRMVEDTDND